MKVIEVEENNAQAEIGGVKKTVRLDVVDRRPEAGDYVIVHAGFALHVIDENEAAITLGYYRELVSVEDKTSQ